MNDEEADSSNNVEDRMRSLPVEELNKYLVCPICNGYFREAHTITECLHTCKSLKSSLNSILLSFTY